MPKPLRYENNNTAIPWLVPRDERIKLDHTDQIFQRWEFDFDLEHHNFLLTLVQEDSYINDSDEKKSVNQKFEDSVSKLVLCFCSNIRKVSSYLYEAFQNGYGVPQHPVLADLILATGVRFKDKKAIELAEQVGLDMEHEDLKIAAMKLRLYIGKIGNNLASDSTIGDLIACAKAVDKLVKELLVEITDDSEIPSLLDCLSKDYVNTYLNYYFSYVEVTDYEVHKFQDTGLLGNAGFFSKLCGCFSGDVAEVDA